MNDDRRPGSSRRVGPARDRAIRQVHDILRASIRRGLLGPDNPLVEFQLIRSLSIGRNTIRAALQLLADEAVVVRRPGIGTLVARPTLRITADEIVALEGSPADHARRIRVEPLAVEPVEIGELLSRTLGLRTGRMTLVEVLVLVDDEPLCILASYLPEGADPDRFTHGWAPIPVSFERILGVPLATTTTTIEAVTADERMAELLDVPVGAALVLREQLHSSADGQKTVLNFARYRADRVAFVTTSAPPATAPATAPPSSKET